MSDLDITRHASTVLFTLNRPQAMNALSTALADALARAVLEVAADARLRCIIVTGAGDRAFSAGADLKERRSMSPEQKRAQAAAIRAVNEAVWSSPKAVIAAIGGWCLGGGLELALHCDLRLASEDSIFGFPEMTLGAYPGAGGAVLLPRIVGLARARQMLFLAQRLDAAQALATGLVDRVIPRADLLAAALLMAAQVEATSPLGLAAVKRLLNEGSNLPFEQANALDHALRDPLDATADYAEGIEAHFQRRSARFRGC